LAYSHLAKFLFIPSVFYNIIQTGIIQEQEQQKNCCTCSIALRALTFHHPLLQTVRLRGVFCRLRHGRQGMP